MPPPPRTLLAEIYLVIEQPRQRSGHWRETLALLDSPKAPPLAAVITHYDAGSDEAVLELQYDARLFVEPARQFVADVALLAEVGMIQPDRLSEDERNRFLGARLARCALRLDVQASVAGAVHRLTTSVWPRRRRSAAIPPVSLPRKHATVAAPPPRIPPDDDDARTSRRQLPRLARVAMHTPPPRPPARGSTAPGRDEDRATSPLDLTAFQAMAADRRLPDRVHVRYLRGGRWLAARIGSLDIKRATLLTGAIPRLNDHVDVALSFGEHRAIVRGVVAKVSTRQEATSMGAAVFKLEFLLDEHSRPQLAALLLAARDARITIQRPPPRGAPRFPVEWSVGISTATGVVKATALDVSVGGAFVRPRAPLLLDTSVLVSAVLDDGNGPITARAKVVRRISDSEAKERGLVAGFGLAIVDMSEAHHVRWLSFLARIERRTQKRVLVGAHPARFAEVQAWLASLGYAVVGGTDPGMLVQLANNDARAADAVLIDASWLQHETSTELVEELFASRNVPCVKMQGELVRVRQTIDRLLEVL